MKIGDSVAAVDDDLNGIVTSVHGETVVFRDQHGFTHQFRKNQLVIQHPELYENLPSIKKEEPRKQVSKRHNKNHLVLDLHFENLVTDPHSYDAFERLFIQKEKLVETVNFCRKNNLKKLEIIHGIGDGVLQKMVHEYLIGQTNIEFEDHDFFYHQTGSVIVTIR